MPKSKSEKRKATLNKLWSEANVDHNISENIKAICHKILHKSHMYIPIYAKSRYKSGHTYTSDYYTKLADGQMKVSRGLTLLNLSGNSGLLNKISEVGFMAAVGAGISVASVALGLAVPIAIGVAGVGAGGAAGGVSKAKGRWNESTKNKSEGARQLLLVGLKLINDGYNAIDDMYDIVVVDETESDPLLDSDDGDDEDAGGAGGAGFTVTSKEEQAKKQTRGFTVTSKEEQAKKQRKVNQTRKAEQLAARAKEVLAEQAREGAARVVAQATFDATEDEAIREVAKVKELNAAAAAAAARVAKAIKASEKQESEKHQGKTNEIVEAMRNRPVLAAKLPAKLPAGWIANVSTLNDIFYTNTVTGKSTWVFPTEAAAAALERSDSSSGRSSTSSTSRESIGGGKKNMKKRRTKKHRTKKTKRRQRN